MRHGAMVLRNVKLFSVMSDTKVFSFGEQSTDDLHEVLERERK